MTPDEVRAAGPTRQDPGIVRTAAAAVLGMLLLSALLGTVGGFALWWLGTQMLAFVR